MIELKELTNKTLAIFNAGNVDELSARIMERLEANDTLTLEEFYKMVDGDLHTDWLQAIFQYYEAERKEKKQDYTPKALAEFVAKLSGDAGTIADLCCGSGSLTIQKWRHSPDAPFELYEIDEKVVPYLMFNMALRNIECNVYLCDILSQETTRTWHISRGEKFGRIESGARIKKQADVILSNPPFNLKWIAPPFAQLQSRFSQCELPPESNANYAFILTALDMADKACFILPTGVLTTNNAAEKAIRKYLVEENLVESVIVCPDRMFESTSIATCLITFCKSKETARIELIDMRQKYIVEERKQNGQFGGNSHENRTYVKQIKSFSDEQMNDALQCIREHKSVPGYCKAITIEEAKNNDYILSPSRYIELAEEKEVHRQYADIVADLNRVIREKNSCKLVINETIAKSLGFDLALYETKHDKVFDELIEKIAGCKIEKDDYFTTTKNKNEVILKNNSKDTLSIVFALAFKSWKQHIYFLNQEENRYLAEMRDALLPDLMSGKIEL